MTPKEKAQELFDKYYIVCQEFTEEIQCSIQAKQCALITVDEVMNADWYIPTFEDNKKWTSYWKEVEQEIEKL
jgi:nucleoside-triphosphatase THEP1